MRAVTRLLLSSVLLGSLGLAGCAGTQKQKGAAAVTELELTYDDGKPAERPMLATPELEWLVKFDPSLPAYKPQRLRFLLAQPGTLRFALYRHDEAGRPGALLTTLEKTYDAGHSSSGRDGKWVSEPLPGMETLTGALWLGISVKAADSEAARLWASKNESAQVYQRDSEPGTALQSGRLPVTPMLRLMVTPELPPLPPPSAETKAPAAEKAPAPVATSPGK